MPNILHIGINRRVRMVSAYMKKNIVYAIFLLLFCSLFANDAQIFTEYGILAPNVNKLETREETKSPSEPIIFIKSRDRNAYILEYDVSNKSLSNVLYKNEPIHSFLESYYDLLHGINYVQSYASLYSFDEKKIIPSGSYKILRETNGNNNTYIFDKCERLTINKDFWISDSSYFKSPGYFTTADLVENTSVLINDKEHSQINFSPELIIGYGRGVVITSRYEENGFEGISLWSEEGELFYQDYDFPLGKPIADIGEPLYQQTINRSYYLYPYVFINVGYNWGIGYTVCLLILDLETNTVYKSPGWYSLLALFE